MDFHKRLLLIFLASIVSAVPQTATACLYFNSKISPNSFKENDREALLFHDGEAANLILKTGFSGTLPAKIAWVFPVSSKPIGYKVTSGRIFRVLNNYIEPQSSGGFGSRSLGGSKSIKSDGIKIHETTQVGQYEVIPIEILSEASGNELNAWLKNQGFIASPLEIQKPYLKKGAFFLAIKADLSGAISNIEPLWIRYKANKLSFPLRFTHDYRSFNLKVYFLMPSGNIVSTPKGLGWDDAPKDRVKEEKVDRYDDNIEVKNDGTLKVSQSGDLFETLMNLLIEFRDVPVVGKFLDRKDLVLTRIMIKGVNSDKTPKILRTRNLTSDPSCEI